MPYFPGEGLLRQNEIIKTPLLDCVAKGTLRYNPTMYSYSPVFRSPFSSSSSGLLQNRTSLVRRIPSSGTWKTWGQWTSTDTERAKVHNVVVETPHPSDLGFLRVAGIPSKKKNAAACVCVWARAETRDNFWVRLRKQSMS